ncbi:unnamed protein product [Symbiodinium necroappetens]|uniref:Sulfotransferase domain-containing protein n=1 Tax=Symbiodinium necroappetens TaxID=1628268 RepID=A0A813A1X2_9DINO|nr:unnamed protein product [Symbiodinium necroappetens]
MIHFFCRWKVIVCSLAVLLLLLHCLTLYLLFPRTQVELIAHAGSHGGAVCRALQSMCRQSCKQWVGCPQVSCLVDKSSRSLRHKREAAQPGLSILLLRDPRDVVVSWRHGTESSSKYQLAVQHIRSVASWTRWQHEQHSGRTESFVLFYEALALQPRETLEALAKFLQLEVSFTEEQIAEWQSVTKPGERCQISSYPPWIAGYLSAIVQKELPEDLRGHWASCPGNVSWAPEPCPRGTELEVHNESRHGDICRRSRDYMCPNMCRQLVDAPYCAGKEQEDPCRAAAAAATWQDMLVPNPHTPWVISTYYEASSKKDGREDARQLTLATWAQHWQRAGWKTRVLGLADAQKSPFYKQLLVKFAQIPLGQNPEYEKACYFRYLAMSEAGGGWMSDYDTLPLHFPATSDLVGNGRFTVLQGHIPALMSGSQEEWARMSRLLVESAVMLTRQTPMPALVSDMHAMAGLVDKSGLKNKSEDALNSFYMVADAKDYLRTLKRPTSSLICRRFTFFRLAIHVSHASLAAAGLALKDADVETQRPHFMNQTMERFWECVEMENP